MLDTFFHKLFIISHVFVICRLCKFVLPMIHYWVYNLVLCHHCSPTVLCHHYLLQWRPSAPYCARSGLRAVPADALRVQAYDEQGAVSNVQTRGCSKSHKCPIAGNSHAFQSACMALYRLIRASWPMLGLPVSVPRYHLKSPNCCHWDHQVSF